MCQVAAQNGVEFRFDEKVTSINKTNEGYAVFAGDQSFNARYVINAAGVHSDEIHNMVAPKAFTIRPTRGDYCVLDKSESKKASCTLFQCPSKDGKGVLVSPTVHGNLLAGPNAVQSEDPDRVNTTAEGIDFVKKMALKSVPGIDFRQTIRQYAGMRANSDCSDFVIGFAEDGFLDLAGIKSPGLSAAPAIALEAEKLLREDGLAGIVCQMWGDIQCHEFLRLPMIYLSAYAASGDTHWRYRYRAYREEAFRLSERIREPGGTDIFSWAYALLQMQYSLRLICDLEEDAAYRDRAAALMGFVADFAERYTAAGVEEADAPHEDEYRIWTQCPAAFSGFIGGYAYYVPQPNRENPRSFALRNAAEAVIIRALCPIGAIHPEQAAMFRHILEKTDFSRAAEYWPILYCDAWALLLDPKGKNEG